MEERAAAAQLAALAHPTRVALVRLLAAHAPSGLPAGAIAVELGVAPSSLSFHLRELEAARLIRPARAGRNILYALELAELRALASFLTETCCGGRPDLCGEGFAATARQEDPRMAEAETETERKNPINVLFLCTGNSCRSIMAECILNREGQGRFRAFSAGSHPKGEIDSQTLAFLREHDYPTEGLRSKSWDEFARPGAAEVDVVITVCDDAAGEVCPVWPGRPLSAHWAMPDPAKVTGSEAERYQVIADLHRMLRDRIRAFVSLPVERLDRLALQAELDAIGRLPRAPKPSLPAAQSTSV